MKLTYFPTSAVRMSTRRNTVVPILSSLCVLKRCKLLLFILVFFFKPCPSYFYKERNKIQVFHYLYFIMHQSIPAALIPPPPGQLRGICTHCQSRGSGISLPKGYPRAFDTHVVSDSKSKRRRFYRKRPGVCH